VDKLQALGTYFGHTAFRGGQESIIDALSSGRDAVCIMQTGAGKSMCYQIPALTASGITLVISPLISLMQDQVQALISNGVKAAYLNSTLSLRQYELAVNRMLAGQYKIIYVAPERLDSPEFAEQCKSLPIDLVAVDEAHCVSQWGQDFRKSYLRIADFIKSLPRRPTVGAFTATATTAVHQDIIRMLELQNPLAVTTGFDRENLYFEVRHPSAKADELLSIVQERQGKSGIIYCATRKKAEEVCSLLCELGLPATKYHAGLPEGERQGNQEDFVYDKKPIMVATNAFGMGIDKSNVAYVVHYNMPKDIESYYQEAGRAGRDGEPADCILLYGAADMSTNVFFIEHGNDNDELPPDLQEELRKRSYERLRKMQFYCKTTDCLRQYILHYFGETGGQGCSNCSNCNSSFETVDITEIAQKIMACISSVKGRFGAKMIIDILRGSKNERILRMNLCGVPEYGVLRGESEKAVRQHLDYLILSGYIHATDSEYPTLIEGEHFAAVQSGGERVHIRKLAERKRKTKKATVGAVINQGMWERLRLLRTAIAAEERVPAYIVFSDATLRDMCAKNPRTLEDMLLVSGVGQNKLTRYGQRFLDCIVKENG